MIDFILDSEPVIRFGFFLSVFIAMPAWEVLALRRRRVASRRTLWSSNIGIVALNTILARGIAPTGTVGLALAAETHGWGITNQLSLPPWLAVAISVLVLDLAIYLQHVLFHAVPLL